MTAHPSDPAVAAFVAGDKDVFFATLTDDAAMSGDGTARDPSVRAERAVSSSNGRMDVEGVSADGRTLTATYTNATWGGTRKRWAFTFVDGRISYSEAGQT